MDRQSIIILSGLGLLIIGGIFWQFSDAFSRIPIEVNENEQIPNELVCMVNDAFMGIEQIPVDSGGKTYYGCCQLCVTKIKKNQDNVRYGIDPYTQEEVDKSEAFITLKPGREKEVLYFASENSMNAYLEKTMTE